MSKHTSALKQFYDEQADKFSGTRQKHRPEFDFLLEYIRMYNLGNRKKIRILELGCGDGRFAQFLDTHCTRAFSYTGVDFSQSLIDLANKKKSHHTFVCTDMLEYIAEPKQESFDIVVSVASFQHLETRKQRLRLLRNIYRILQYGGLHLSINRCYSNWFTKKFARPLFMSFLKMCVSLGQRDKHNVLVPFTNEKKTYHRLYHIFTDSELDYLSKTSGFIPEKIAYITGEGALVDSPAQARNSLLVQRKDVFV